MQVLHGIATGLGLAAFMYCAHSAYNFNLELAMAIQATGKLFLFHRDIIRFIVVVILQLLGNI
jgi:hypothetical protein